MKISPSQLEQVTRRIADIEAMLGEVGAPRGHAGTAQALPARFRDLLAAFCEEQRPASRPAGNHGGGRPLPETQEAALAHAAATYHIRRSLLRAVMQVESGGNPYAVSPKGARGLMQLMPGTAAALGVTDIFDPTQNIMGGARYLRENLDRFNGDESLALAAYNAGPGAVQRHQGVPPFPETRRYVNQVLALATERE